MNEQADTDRPAMTAPALDSAEDLFDHAPCGYLSLLPDGLIVRVNQTLLDWTGLRRTELVGHRRFADLLSPGGRVFHETHYAPLLRLQREVREIALDIVCADGQHLPVIVNSVLREDDTGQPQSIRTTLFHATGRKEYERELVRARERERRAREYTERLQRLTARLAAALLPAQIAAAVIDELVRSLAVDHANLAVVEGSERLRVIGAHGHDPVHPAAGQTQGLAPGGVVAAALFTAAPLVFGSAAARIDGFPAAGTPQPPSEAMVLLPLVLGERQRGVLTLGWSEPREFSTAEQTFMATCAAQAAQALQRARLTEQTAQTARRSAFLAALSRSLGEAPDLGGRAQRLMQSLVPELADGVTVRLTDTPDTAGLLVSYGRGQPAVSGVSTRDVGRDGLEAALTRAIVADAPQLIGPGSGGEGEDTARSAVALPLHARGRVLGALLLVRRGQELRFDADDLPYLADLADRAGLALENARLYEQEYTVARTLQRSLLGVGPPHDQRFAVASHYRPALASLEVGGDWHDTFTIGEHCVAISTGDVVGRGISAATAMGQLRSAVRALAQTRQGPAQLMQLLDRFVADHALAQMATLAYAEIDLNSGVMHFACAGHPPPVLIEPGQEPHVLWEGRSMPLGAFGGAVTRTQAELTLSPGARVLLYTDGLIEDRARSIDDGIAALVRELAARRGDPPTLLVDELTDALVQTPNDDDVCTLCFVLGPADFERRLPMDTRRLAPLRAELRAWLGGDTADAQDREAVVLAVTEAVANAMRHGYRDETDGVVSIQAQRGPGRVRLQVRDHGAWRPPLLDGSGMGLMLIRKLMDEVEIEHGAGTAITMSRRLRTAPSSGA